MVKITTRRFDLRPFATADWPDVLELAVDWSQAPGPGFDKWPTAEDGVKSLTEFFAKDGRFVAVVLRESNRVIGLLALNGVDENQQMDLGHVILSRYQDNDHDREALGAMVAAIFEKDGIDSIVTKNAPDHPEQLAPLKALGFQVADQEQLGILVLNRPQP